MVLQSDIWVGDDDGEHVCDDCYLLQGMLQEQIITKTLKKIRLWQKHDKCRQKNSNLCLEYDVKK